MSLIGAALIGGAATLLGGAMSNASQRSENRKAYERNLAMWNMENEYNHPTQQMARLREAGLNPNMVYGSGATTLAASTKPSQPANVGFPQLDILSALNSYQDLKQKDAMTENIKAQKAVTEATARQAEANARIAEKDAKLYAETGVNPQRPVSQNVFSRSAYYVRKAGEYVGDKFGDWWYSLPEGDYNGGKLY